MHLRTAIDCPIAGKTVTARPRSGVHLGEPHRPHVRCSERDCQYVDVNQPPCPLRVDMFDGGDDQQLRTHLGLYPGQRLCYECLAIKLERSHDAIRRMASRLSFEGAAVIAPAPCVACGGRRRVTIRLSRPAAHSAASTPIPSPVTTRREDKAAVDEAHARILATIRNPTVARSCATCVAWASELPLDTTRRALDVLASRGVVRIDGRGLCDTCGRAMPIVLPA